MRILLYAVYSNLKWRTMGDQERKRRVESLSRVSSLDYEYYQKELSIWEKVSWYSCKTFSDLRHKKTSLLFPPPQLQDSDPYSDLTPIEKK